MVIPRMIYGFFAVKAQLEEYRQILRKNPSPLSRQGLDSLRDKEFHCLGGSVYALLAQGKQRRAVLKFIVAFQTISDYLDNLCDRFGIHSEEAFRQLHTAMLDSLEPGAVQFSDYYAFFPYRDDGGYLQGLAADCRRALNKLPSFSRCRDQAVRLTKLYIDLQSLKHMERRAGEESLAKLYQDHEFEAQDLHWWEFSAACGSTLGVFAMVASGSDPWALYTAYMPWVNGFHILMDYFIDQEEDIQHNDMNLVSYYGGSGRQVERLLWFYRQAQRAVKSLDRRRFHALICDGLLALYLSDTKAWAPALAGTSRQMLQSANLRARVLHRIASILRRRGVI